MGAEAVLSWNLYGEFEGKVDEKDNAPKMASFFSLKRIFAWRSRRFQSETCMARRADRPDGMIIRRSMASFSV